MNNMIFTLSTTEKSIFSPPGTMHAREKETKMTYLENTSIIIILTVYDCNVSCKRLCAQRIQSKTQRQPRCVTTSYPFMNHIGQSC